MHDTDAEVETIKDRVTCEQGTQKNEPHGVQIHTLWLLCFRHGFFVQRSAGGRSENVLGCRVVEDLNRLRSSADSFGDRISREHSLLEPVLKKSLGIQDRPAGSITNNVRVDNPWLPAYFCSGPSQFICRNGSNDGEYKYP